MYMDLIKKINELINENTIEKLSSISGENKIKIEESLKSCIATTLYVLVHKNSEELDTVIQISKSVIEVPVNGQNYSILLKNIFGDNLEGVLYEISKNNNSNTEAVHLVANAGVVCIFKAFESLITSQEVFFIKNLLSDNQDKIKDLLPGYMNKTILEKKVSHSHITSPLTQSEFYDENIE